MKGQITVIKPGLELEQSVVDNDDVTVVKPYVKTRDIDHTPSLEEIKRGAFENGEMLEVIPLFEKFLNQRCVAFCDEEGKLKGLPYNHIATTLWSVAVGEKITSDHLVGPVVIVSGDDELLDEI